MGCDIHLHVEVKKRGEENASFQKTAFRGQFSDRIYGMFAALANVRNYPHFNIKPIPIRGLPKDIGWEVNGAIFKEVVDDYVDDYQRESCYLKEDVDRWVKGGYSFVIERNGFKFCSDPAAHSFNWCTPDEMQECVDQVFKKDGEYNHCYIEWLGLAGYMKALEDNGKYEVRAVYWFDN